MIVFFSIITPTFNRSNELERCYNSIKKQTFKSFEWIICDDGSTDSTEEVVGMFDTAPVKYFRKNNGGVNSARNSAQGFVKGKYTIYLDSDDELYDENTLLRIFKDIELIGSDNVRMISYDSCANVFQNDFNAFPQLDSLDNWLCNSKMGERIIVVNSIEDTQWPRYNGYEGIKHYKMLGSGNCYYIARAERIYHQGANNQLSTVSSFLNNSEDGYYAIDEIWLNYKTHILEKCSCRSNELLIQKIFRSLFIENRSAFYNAIAGSFRYLSLKNKLLTLFFFIYLYLPFSVRKSLFLKFWR